MDKVTIAAMQSLLQTYLFDDTPQASVPTLRMACESSDVLRARAQAIVDALPGAFDVTVNDDTAALGGGSFATAELPSVAMVVGCESDSAATALAARLRMFDTPVVARVKGREVRFNMRTVQVDEDKQLASALGACLKA